MELYGFSWVDALAIGAAFPLWLTAGVWLVGEAPRLTRYGWGGLGGLLVATGLFLYHGLGAWLWMPWLTVAVGLGWMAAMHGATGAREAWKRQRARRRAAETAQPEGD